jgi:RNA polymerase sigma factor (sigma-70 family)
MPFLRTERSLLDSFRRGDRRALERVYWLYARGVERVIMGHLSHAGRRSRDDLREVLHDTFVRAFSPEARAAYDGIRDYAPYLNVIARNAALRWIGKRAREVSLEGDAIQLQEAQRLRCGDNDWPDPGTMILVEQYLHELPEDLRRVHEQRFVHGRPQWVAAEFLGLSRQQVRTLERRLREGLSRHLAAAETSMLAPGPVFPPLPARGERGR